MMDGIEPVGISPRVDCVFKSVLREPTVLLDFLNAVLDWPDPIVAVELIPAEHTPRFIGEHASRIDVKATDAQGRVFQVEMQNGHQTALKPRMIYGWADVYSHQLRAGDGYKTLRPTVAIWLVDHNIFRGGDHFHHRFVLYDPQRERQLSPHLEIHTLELERWRQHADQPGAPAIQGWMAFFSGAEDWATIPEQFTSPAMEAAMDTLKEFKRNLDLMAIYTSQRKAMFEANTLQHDKEELEKNRQETKRMQAEIVQMTANLEKLRAEVDQKTAEAEQKTAEAEQLTAEAEQKSAEAEQKSAEAEQKTAEAEQLTAEAEQKSAEAEQKSAEAEQKSAELAREAERLRVMLRELGVDPDSSP